MSLPLPHTTAPSEKPRGHVSFRSRLPPREIPPLIAHSASRQCRLAMGLPSYHALSRKGRSMEAPEQACLSLCSSPSIRHWSRQLSDDRRCAKSPNHTSFRSCCFFLSILPKPSACWRKKEVPSVSFAPRVAQLACAPALQFIGSERTGPSPRV